MLARWLATRREAPTMLRDLIVPGLIAGVPGFLVLKQPDAGSAIVFAAILFFMLFWAGTKPSLLLLAASPVIGLALAFNTVAWGAWIAVLAVLLLWWRPYVWESFAIMGLNVLGGVIALPMWNRLAPYQQNRLLAFLNPDVDPRGAGWHVIQSKVAVGSGGLVGKGFTEGTQKRLAFLPAQHTDFIFSIVGEELGFVGVLVALALFAWLLFALLRIARRATDQFSSLCVFGVAGLLFTHIFENVGMTINLMPITGIPLPFFSYGGSFLLACSIGLGIALRSAGEARRPPEIRELRRPRAGRHKKGRPARRDSHGLCPAARHLDQPGRNGLRVHGWLDGLGGGGKDRPADAPRHRQAHPADPRLCLRRRAHAGCCTVTHADGEDFGGGCRAAGCRDPVHFCPHEPHHRRRIRVLRHAG